MAESFEDERAFLTHVSPKGALTGSYGRGIQVDLRLPGPTSVVGKTTMKRQGFGRIIHSSEYVPLAGNNIPRWRRQPRYTANINGTQHRIDDQIEWELSLAMEQLNQDMAIASIVGSEADQGDSQGLRSSVSDEDVNPYFHSLVVDWKANPLMLDADQSAEITINGKAFTMKGLNIYYVMRNMQSVTERLMRKTRKPLPTDGDVGLILPSDLIQPIAESSVCWVDCGRDITRMTSDRASEKLSMALGGGIGHGHLTGQRNLVIPFIPFDPPDYTESADYHLLVKGGVAEMYQLVKGRGAEKYITFQYNDLSDGASQGDLYEATEDGRILAWKTIENMALRVHASTQWRLMNYFPQFQVKWVNVPCDPMLNVFDLVYSRSFPSAATGSSTGV